MKIESLFKKGIENESTQKDITQTLGKDNSTIGTEIKSHRLDKECKVIKTTNGYGKCNLRDPSPGSCNGCPDIEHARFNDTSRMLIKLKPNMN